MARYETPVVHEVLVRLQIVRRVEEIATTMTRIDPAAACFRPMPPTQSDLTALTGATLPLASKTHAHEWLAA